MRRQRPLWPGDRAPIQRRAHGLTPAQRDALLRAQGNQCPGCHRPLASGEGEIDHDHRHCPGATGCIQCVSGVLCQACNSSIGFARDNVETMTSLIAYLRRTRR